jgi:hypothetical protein
LFSFSFSWLIGFLASGGNAWRNSSGLKTEKPKQCPALDINLLALFMYLCAGASAHNAPTG